jgi:Ras-related protein Rab-8A
MGILLVYDVSDRNTFGNIRNWLRQVEQHAAENVIRIIIGNKSCIDDDARVVTPEEGLALANEYKVDFFETSAKNDINVDDAFGLISRRIMERRFEDEGKAAVSSRVMIRPDMRKKKPGIGVAAAVGMVVVAPFALVAAPFYFGYKAAASTTASCQE